MTGQYAGVNVIIAGVQQANNDAAPDAVFNIEFAVGGGNMDVRMLIELAPVGVQCAEDANLDALFTRMLSMAWVAQRNRPLSSVQLLLKNGYSKCGMVNEMNGALGKVALFLRV